MIGKIFDVIGAIGGVVDDLHTSEEEKLQMKAGLLKIQTDLIVQSLEYEKALSSAQASIVQAEAQSKHWITSTWRPLTMLTFLFLIVLNYFGFGPPEIPPDLWFLMKLGLGGYVVGRSAEKVTQTALGAAKKAEET